MISSEDIVLLSSLLRLDVGGSVSCEKGTNRNWLLVCV